MVSPAEWTNRFKETGFLVGKPPSVGEEYRAYCPSCENPETSKSPSASFNFKKNTFYCQKCSKTFPYEDLWKMARKKLAKNNSKKPKEEDSSSEETLPSPSQLKVWRDDLRRVPGCLNDLKSHRGLSDDTIAKYGLGYSRRKKRYTIPVYDARGQLKNVRYYAMNAGSRLNKMINHTGHGDRRLYLPDALEQDEILLCEGEMDTLIARDRGFNSMGWTSGVSSWDDRWSHFFEGKRVYICFDDDDAGRMGARKVAVSLYQKDAKVHVIQLSLPGIKNGDLTDYFHSEGNTAEEFRALMDKSSYVVAGKIKESRRPEGTVEKVSVDQSFQPKFFGYPLEVIATVHGKGPAPYLIPREINYSCGQNWGDKCKKCELAVHDGDRDVKIAETDEVILKMIDSTSAGLKSTIHEFAGIPPRCPQVEVEVKNIWTVEELMVMPAVETRSEEISVPVERTVFNVGDDSVRINDTFRIVGSSLPHPKDQRAVFMAWECEPVEVDIDKFVMTKEIRKRLEVFRVKEWKDQTPFEKMREIADDLAYNVTEVYGRPELHMACDLVWHSAMSFRLGRKIEQKGWLEMLVLGDTRTGKSAVVTSLADHYQSGMISVGETASFAGLIGGSTQGGFSKNWFTKWGLIPLNDRRLVVLDEAGGLKDKKIIESMSSIRSNGIAEIVKMGGQKTQARTRLIWILNPVDGRPIRKMANGAMDGIHDFLQNPEDIARFDLAMSAASEDVPIDVLERERDRTPVHPVYTSEICKLLVTWAWSRRADQIIFCPGVRRYIYRKAKSVSSRYVVDIPLVQEQNFHVKLARLSVAVAMRVFSTTKDGEYVLVGKEHVDTAVKILDGLYGKPSFGYRKYSKKKIADEKFAESMKEDAHLWLLGEPGSLNTLISVKNSITFKNRDFEDSGGMTRFEASEAVQKLVSMGMLENAGKGNWTMKPALHDVVRELEELRRLERLERI